MRSRSVPVALVAGCAVVVALVLQTSVFSQVAWRGVAPNLVLLVVVAVGLARGAQASMLVGFAAGVLLDLAPPADHVAGRWALALLVVGWVAGRVRHDGAPPLGLLLAAAIACSFLGSSLFALSGLLLRDPALGVGDLLQTVLAAVVYDGVVALLVIVPLLRMLPTSSAASVPA